ncbi:MAG: RnfABCDGE type electron transport complex subunit D [Bacteroidia bacterium]
MNVNTATPRAARIPLAQIGRWFLKDARHFQILSLSIFLCYGIVDLGWNTHLDRILLTVGTCLLTQALWVKITKAPWHSLKSALISSLGLCLLLKTNMLSTAAIAAVITISSKFIVQMDRKHIFNPVNFGIILTVMLTGDAWISPGQWGSSFVTLFFVGSAGLMVLLKCGRIDISLGFIGSYFALEFIRTVLWLGWPIDHWTHMVTNGAILLFTFFMITDPVTTPNHQGARIAWAVMVGLLTFALNHLFILNSGAPIWALFIISPLTLVFDKVFKAQKFSWL